MPPSLFQGDKIELRPFELRDADALASYINHPDLVGRRYLPWSLPDVLPLSRKQIEHALNEWAEDKKGAHFAVLLRDTGEIVGHAECEWGWDTHCPEVAIVIAPAHQRKGYGSDVLRLLLKYLFENTPAHNVGMWFASWNEAGRAFIKHHGFVEGGGMRRAGIFNGNYVDAISADILRPEWKVRYGEVSHAA